MMYNKEFLRKLDQDRHRVVYGRISAMDLNERVLEQSEGVITGGSLNIDGKSATRRSLSLTMITHQIDLSNAYWGFKTKFRLELGIENHIDSNQPDIIWFNQGVFIITDFSSSFNNSSYTINITAKDKMCLLDGSIGGTINGNVDFGKYEQEETIGTEKKYTMIQQQIKDIIRDAVHQFAGEPYQNIVINDIPDIGLELQEYRYNIPLYLWRERSTSGKTKFLSGTIDGTAQVYYNGNFYPLQDLPSDFIFDPLNSAFAGDIIPSRVDFVETPYPRYYIAKFDAGESIGYKQTLLFYPNDLIENAGSTIVALLDKIKAFLGNFEYFYDVDGRFIFQKKKTYETESWSPLNDTSYDISTPSDSQYSYEFMDSSLFTSINYNPSLRNTRNDFTVWGKRTSIDGSQLSSHMRVAIDVQPYKYTTISVSDEELIEYNQRYGLDLKGQESITYVAQSAILSNGVPYSIINNVIELDASYYSSYFQENIDTEDNDQENILQLNTDYKHHKTASGDIENNNTLVIDLQDFIYHNTYVCCDWREIIYQMARDYNKYGHLDNFTSKLIEANPHLTSGKTGYEQYYIDIEGFWRTLYKPIDAVECLATINSYPQEYLEQLVEDLTQAIKNTDNPSEETLEDLKEWTKRLDFYRDNEKYYYFTGKSVGNYEMITNEKLLYWARDVVENPSNLVFWFDFLNATGELKKFSVPVIGNRPKVETQADVQAIAYHDTPEVLIGTPEFSSSITKNYSILQLGPYEDLVAKSAQGQSAKEAMDNLIFNYVYATDSISITSVPIYHLEPNTRIYIKDEESKIDGDYIINSISLPLTYNGTMNLSATKAPIKIF